MDYHLTVCVESPTKEPDESPRRDSAVEAVIPESPESAVPERAAPDAAKRRPKREQQKLKGTKVLHKPLHKQIENVFDSGHGPSLVFTS